ncbi:MAG: hypothetical protein AAB410_03275 [Patescibacteria group bacterium]
MPCLRSHEPAKLPKTRDLCAKQNRPNLRERGGVKNELNHIQDSRFHKDAGIIITAACLGILEFIAI